MIRQHDFPLLYFYLLNFQDGKKINNAKKLLQKTRGQIDADTKLEEEMFTKVKELNPNIPLLKEELCKKVIVNKDSLQQISFSTQKTQTAIRKAIEQVYKSRFVQHYYTSFEINSFIKKWTKTA